MCEQLQDQIKNFKGCHSYTILNDELIIMVKTKNDIIPRYSSAEKDIFKCLNSFKYKTHKELTKLLTDNNIKGRSKAKTKKEKIKMFFKYY